MDQKKQQKIKDEKVESVEVGKVFHLYERRNEWVNWSGDTDIVSRSGRAVKLFLFEAEQSAEKSRLQGTKFFIDEVPAVCIRGTSGALLLLTELFSDRPMGWYFSRASSLNGVKTLGSLMDALVPTKWGVQSLYEEQMSVTPLDGKYFSRVSFPGNGKNHMAWSLKVRKIDDQAIQKVATELQWLVSGAIE